MTHDISDHDSSLEEKWHVPSFSNNDGLILGFFGFPYIFCTTSQNYKLFNNSMYLNTHPHIRKTLLGISNECNAIISSPFIGIC